MFTRKKEFIEYLRLNDSRFSISPVHPGIRAVLQGDFNRLPEHPTDNDWQMLALMINGYNLSSQLGLGNLEDYLIKQCLPQFLESGILPSKSIELWIFLFGMQRSEKWRERPLEENEKRGVLEIYKALRTKLMQPNGVDEMIKSMNITDYENFRRSLIHRYWIYQEENFRPWEKYFDRPNNDYRRPPVFLETEARLNVITNPLSTSNETENLFKLIPLGEHHKWFRSMNSSQALSLSILGNLKVYNLLDILADLKDDNELPLLENENIAFDDFTLEHKINHLGEPRRTSIDAFIPGEYQIAIECKFTESEVGGCSRPRLSEKDSNYQKDRCDGSYSRQRGRRERCTLSENGIKYWEYIPQFFNWNKNEDMADCKLRRNYQLVRNILAAGVKPDGSTSNTNGHAILIYDERNPSCQPGGAIYKAYTETREALIDPKMLRKISWQRITSYIRDEKLLPWLTDQLILKYGL